LQIKNINTVVQAQKATPSIAFKFLLQSLGLISFVILLGALQQAHAEGSGIVKWKDDKGVTHYGDKIPPQYSNTENSIINKQGITVKRNKPVTVQDEAISQAKVEQDKKDKALLSAFTNESEIDLARDRNLQLDQVTVDGLLLQRANSVKRLTDNQKYASSFTAKKKPVPADLAADIKNSQQEVAKIDQQIADRKASMEATRKRFEADKKRYIALKNYANGSGPPPGPPEVVAPVAVPVPTTAPAATNQPPAVPSNNIKPSNTTSGTPATGTVKPK
jgi:hypothetical protein